jgi:hypothetical protein
MGKLSGVNANLITKVSGVPVANISKVGPILASSIGLGGGGGPARVFATDAWATALEACINGQKAIDKNGPMTLYQQGDFFYYDSEFANPFNGDGSWWWCQTVNFSYQINTEGGIITSQNCSSGGSKIFTTIYYGNGEETCYNGPGAISKGNTQTLYPSGEFFYTDSGLTTPFNGGGVWWYNGTDNISYQIGNEGNTMDIFSCG